MKLLAIESSGMSAGCAYLEDGVLKGEYYLNTRLTHSCTLLPMIADLQKTASFQLSELDAIAVSAGPGSFTGLRIGAATAKGLALGLELPLVRVSSLKGLAANLPFPETFLCPLMDARRGEVYGAVYQCRVTDGEFLWTPLLEDSALSIETYLETLRRLIEEKDWKAMFTGDGVPVHRERILEILGDKALFAPTALNRQRASSVAVLGAEEFRNGNLISSDDFVPEYLRKPMAETTKEEGKLEDAGSISLKKIARGEFKRTRNPLNRGEES